jgi:hypothetical protein
MIGGTSYSVPTITEANCLRIGLALGNDFFNATVKCLALLLHSTETKSNCCQGNGREDSGRDLNHAIGKHRFLLATAVFALAAGLFTGGLVGHEKGNTALTLWTGNVP